LNQNSEFEKVVYDNKFRVLLSKEKIDSRITELGQQITADYRGKNPIMIGVLNGGFLFMADLVRHVEIDLEVDFIKISSYGDSKKTSGNVTMLKDINAEVKNRHLIIVEDIVDTGLSIQYLKKKFSQLMPSSIKFVSLLQKKENAKVDYFIDYIGFEIPNEFVVGYGLDHKQILRNLPAVYVMD
jgi:hypoxanthine phosphoribosyltransferase